MCQRIIKSLLLIMCLLTCSCNVIHPIDTTDDEALLARAAMDMDTDRVDASQDMPPRQDMPPNLELDMPRDMPRDQMPNVVFDQAQDLAPDLEPDMPAAFDPRTEPMRVLFLGNSFTHQGPVPTFVHTLATQAGWPEPEVTFVAPGGKSLGFHREHAESLQAVDQGGWHAVVLQDLSTRPTDNLGDPDAFKQDALWFFERVQSTSPGARVLLYMTWARHPNHGIYPGTFTDPAQMQDQISFHYRDAVEQYIPDNAQRPDTSSLVELAPVGDVWRHHLEGARALRLHGDDDYHAGTFGRWLNALTIYAVLYQRRVMDLPVTAIAPGVQPLMTASVDAITGQDVLGGPDGVPFAPLFMPDAFEVGDHIAIDFGPDNTSTSEAGWNNVSRDTARIEALVDQADEPTRISFEMTALFSGMNTSGTSMNTVGFPASASQDSIWSGVLDGTHEQAIMNQGAVKLLGLDPQGVYEVLLFGSRMGMDGELGRLGRYQIAAQVQDFDVTDNEDMFVVFERVTPTPQGEIELTINVSPEGTSRYSYLGAMKVRRLE